ncbi:MAG: NAD(P)H-dependent oxidoreductase [Syntrophales bacterium]
MQDTLVVYHSQTGHTKRMAESVAKGAGSVVDVEVIIKRSAETTLQDLLDCDGLAIGSPEYFGYMAGMIKDFFDRTYNEVRGKREIFRKPYVIFISAGNDGIGALNSIERIFRGYQFRKVFEPVVARREITEEILARGEELGKTIAAGCEAGIY